MKKSRKELNLQLLEILTSLINDHPNARFSQILQNFGFTHYLTVNKDEKETYSVWVNEFYTEPEVLLERVNRSLKAYDKL